VLTYILYVDIHCNDDNYAMNLKVWQSAIKEKVLFCLYNTGRTGLEQMYKENEGHETI